MNSKEASERALRLIPTQQMSEEIVDSLRATLLTNIPVALEILARRVAGDEKRMHMLRKIAASGATVTTGIADLSTIIGTDKVLQDYLYCADFTLNPDTDGLGSFYMVGSVPELSLTRPTDSLVITGVVEGSSLYTKDTNGATNTTLGAIQVIANYIPTLAQLPFGLNAEFLDAMVTISLPAPPKKQRAA